MLASEGAISRLKRMGLAAAMTHQWKKHATMNTAAAVACHPPQREASSKDSPSLARVCAAQPLSLPARISNTMRACTIIITGASAMDNTISTVVLSKRRAEPPYSSRSFGRIRIWAAPSSLGPNNMTAVRKVALKAIVRSWAAIFRDCTVGRTLIGGPDSTPMAAPSSRNMSHSGEAA